MSANPQGGGFALRKKIFEGFTLYNTAEDFGEVISIKGEIAASDFEGFKQRIFDSSNGKVNVAG